MLKAISPIDGRYQSKTQSLSPFFSEYALIKYRIYVELEYLEALIMDLELVSNDELVQFQVVKSEILKGFDEIEAVKVKEIEKVTNHDVKAVEYYIKEILAERGFDKILEFTHFGLTSQDINNTAFPLMIKNALSEVIVPTLSSLLEHLIDLSMKYQGIPMLARTHGQPASPTTLGKEIFVFVERLENEMILRSSITLKAKFGGATGNLNAHKIAYPHRNWVDFANAFIENLGLERYQTTTQIAHYDDLAALCQSWMRINTILIDFCRDIWTYISMEYFTQKVIAGEVGSSAMPHKVNPIDFENAEGNLGVANALFSHLAEKLPISRLQRDLTDSTVLRNVGVPFAHTLISLLSILKGLTKLELNEKKLQGDLDKNWAVTAEAIQNILRREGIDKPYEKLKELTRGNTEITQQSLIKFIQTLDVNENVKQELLEISPYNYVGYF
ncbi:MAG TPA: adenylosuccinate lyase [Saprospiraceae bacterium]|nr:adenylosuccinate lyase [Lewinellaceae bacterium]HPQ21164.1 adenylosuccinate lyase [Saprospiraceae bacterium]